VRYSPVRDSSLEVEVSRDRARLESSGNVHRRLKIQCYKKRIEGTGVDSTEMGG